jgi:ribosomal protein S18 acetylase RimI-like enzyme
MSIRSEGKNSIHIRPMEGTDRAVVAEIITSVGNFSQEEIDCALELVDIYLNDSRQEDYRIVVATDNAKKVCGYACWGRVPLTRGTFDLYWVATHPGVQGQGFGSMLMAYVEKEVKAGGGRLLVLETSGKESYGRTVRFYRRLGYEQVSLIRDFYDTGDDKLVFVKKISR